MGFLCDPQSDLNLLQFTINLYLEALSWLGLFRRIIPSDFHIFLKLPSLFFKCKGFMQPPLVVWHLLKKRNQL